ncbi:MAG: tRNA (N6-isopentenyl adenosine(37)-C2)-methylthiotransferase MiaB [Verrucomicrobia bacterium]|nr:tRNA (N6-isopentenyl adenosine(37)-C2)-methylthiotransferase MiaB [Verrucomicrobiota bacterium]
MPKVYIRTYGCQMNERDSEQVARQFQERGYALTPNEREADVILLNTCSVRDQAEQKAMGNMGRLRRLKRGNPNLVLGFMGCMAQSRGSDLLDRLPDVDLVVGTQRFHRVADYVEELRRPDLLNNGSRPRIADVETEKGSENAIRDHLLEPQQPTAFVSIMQGCNLRCAFCIVPATRGPERSRPISDIAAEVRTLAAHGVKEVTLLGQIVNFYGRHEFAVVGGKTPFVQLLEAMNDVEGIERIRFASPHPGGFREDLIGAMAELPKVCEHVHLPLQSGSNRVLKAMRRTYSVETYRRIVERLRERVPGIAVSTDLIVGFPGETESEFQQTLALTREMEFDQAFVFRYSPRKETPAADMEAQHPEEEKERRNQELLAVVNEHVKRRLALETGADREILVENVSKTNPDRMMGRTRQNRIVVFAGTERHRGQLMRIRIERALGFTLLGSPVAG